jgi:hypothetical protein
MQSPTELQQRLQQAAEILEQAGLPEDLRPIAFGYLLGERGVGVAPALAGRQPLTDAGAVTAKAVPSRFSGGELLGKIAVALGHDRDVVARFFEEEDGQVRVIVKRSMLLEPDRKAASIRHVALLVVVGRQAAGVEEHTSFDVIREECRELKVFDASNFAAEVGKLEFRTTGGRNSKEARANRHHYDEAADLIRRMTEAAES